MSKVLSEFRIPRNTDRTVVNGLLRALEEVELPWQSLAGGLPSGKVVTTSPDDEGLPPELEQWLAEGEFVFEMFTLKIHRYLTLTIERDSEGHPADKAKLAWATSNPLNLPENVENSLDTFMLHVKRNLSAFVPVSGGEGVGTSVDGLEAAESQIALVAGSIREAVRELTEGSVAARQKLEEDLAERAERLHQEFESRKAALEKSQGEQESKLKQDREELDRRIGEIDDRESRHVRRNIREDLKKELQRRSERFELTAGTKKLRAPVFWFTLLLLALFGGAFLWSLTAYPNDALLGTPGTESIPIILKQIALGAAFGSTAIFFLKWNNQWFRQHADEEFRLKRFTLDLDRASWVVEMALEWYQETQRELPQELIDRLTIDLFGHTASSDDALHPADQLAAALLGSSSGMSLEVPGGSAIRFDRKAIKRLMKEDGNRNERGVERSH